VSRTDEEASPYYYGLVLAENWARLSKHRRAASPSYSGDYNVRHPGQSATKRQRSREREMRLRRKKEKSQDERRVYWETRGNGSGRDER
jgi:hypothetical protein